MEQTEGQNELERDYSKAIKGDSAKKVEQEKKKKK